MRNFTDRVLQKIRKSQDIAAWYRLLSSDQIRGLLNLSSAIRDDQNQCSTYRVTKCLTDLGIVEPMVGKKTLKKLIECCRGSDLAFLYFLLIGFYKSDRKSNIYSYNEQVLMSSIMELDLEMTLHALDQILPPGHLSHRDQLILAKENELKLIEEKKCNSPKKMNNILPYFWRQPRPKEYIPSKPNNSVRPDIVVSFPFWPVGQAANYKLDNNRWFATYKLQPIKRLAHSLVTDIINNFCSKCFPHDQPKDDNNDINLCDTHRNALESQQTVKDELIVNAFQHCLDLYNFAKENKLRKERIIAQLDRDIENYTEKLRKLDHTQFTDVGILEDCKLCKYDKQMTTLAQKSNIKCLIDENDVGNVVLSPTSSVDHNFNKCKSFNDRKIDRDAYTSALYIYRSKRTLQKKRNYRLLNTTIIKKRKNVDPNFFTASQMHQPFLFNYQRTFDPHSKPRKSIKVIRRGAVHALTDVEKESFSLKSSEQCFAPCNYDSTSSLLEFNRDQVIEAIVNCAELMWRNSVTSYERKQAAVRSQIEANLKNGEKQYLQYKQTYFDPDDSQLMDSMLLDGIKILRCDPNYVLATFPDAHKTIVMREWIKRRYGKTYSDNEVLSLIKKSEQIFYTILLMHNREPPSVNTKPYIVCGLTYADREKMFKMANKSKTKYYKDLNERIMQNTAICWTGMGAEFRKGSCLKDMFYSYLPARTNDIHVHPWKGDMRSMKKKNPNGS